VGGAENFDRLAIGLRGARTFPGVALGVAGPGRGSARKGGAAWRSSDERSARFFRGLRRKCRAAWQP
jgi:hypothetical protein